MVDPDLPPAETRHRVRTLSISLALLAVTSSAAAAAPAADLVVVWAPGSRVAPIEAAARAAGAAVIDRSPAAAPGSDLGPLVQRGIAAYDALKFEDGRATLELARDRADRTGAAGLTATQLSDLFLYRGLIAGQGQDPTTAWDELITAVVVSPTRVLDPARFPPRVVEQLERVRVTVAERPRVALRVDAPVGCTITVDGSVATAAPVIAGSHWVHVTCADHAPWGTRVEVAAPMVVTARPVPLAPPSDADVLIQARAAGARSLVVVEVRGQVATARVIGLDGRERDRRTVAIHGDLAPIAEVVRVLLRPGEKSRWYQSRWVWAGAAAAIAAAILIPVTAAVTRDSTPLNAAIRPGGFEWQ